MASRGLRNHVAFRYPAPFVAFDGNDGILATGGAGWFATMLGRIPEAEVDRDLCQEDWGVVIFARRRGLRFWVGLSPWLGEDGAWLAHFHHGDFAWLQRLGAPGRRGLFELIREAHTMLAADPAVTVLGWYRQEELHEAREAGAPTPDAY